MRDKQEDFQNRKSINHLSDKLVASVNVKLSIFCELNYDKNSTIKLIDMNLILLIFLSYVHTKKEERSKNGAIVSSCSV